MNRHFILLSALLCGTLVGQAQQPVQTPDELYTEGRQLYLRGHHAAARQTLDRFIRTASGNTSCEELLPEAEYMAVCTAYSLKETDRFEQLLDYLLRYPDTPHANRLYALAGNSLYADGEYERAIDCYRKCSLEQLADDERDEATLYKGVSLLKSGQEEEAYTLLTVVQLCSPRYEADARYYKAYIDYSYRRYPEALPAMQTLSDHPVYGLHAPYYVADILLQQGDYEEAFRTADFYLRKHPQAEMAAEMRRIAGEADYGLGNYEEAVLLLTAYTEACQSPRRNALYKLGMSLLQQGDCAQAASRLTQATTEEDALTQNACLHSGIAYVQLRDMPKARMAFGQAASMDYDRHVKEQALYNYALCIHETAYSGFGESVTVFERFLNEFPSSAYAEQVNDYLIEVYMNTRSYKAALQSIAKIMQPGRRILEARQKILYRLGTEAFANADYPGAADYFSQSLADAQYSRQTEADAYFWRGEAKYRQTDYRGAANDYRQYLAKTTATDPTLTGTAYYNLGYTAFQQKDYTHARSYYERFLNEYRTSSTSQMVADALNRTGDCHFYARNFPTAEKYYAEATATDPAQGDYALYQQAFVQGLQKDYAGKVASLDRMIAQHPQSSYADDALYERGRAYVQMEQTDRAIASFSELTTRFPESSLARKAANEIGLLLYQTDRYEEAITAYKRVIENYPGSEEARLAQRDLKSIYIDLNRVDDYAAYAASQKGVLPFDTNERDSITYLAAEKAYMRGDMEEAVRSLNAYLLSFPEGGYRLHAHYYLGVSAHQRGENGTALTHFNKVLEYPDNKFSEEAMTLAAEISFNQKDYARALTLYKLLRGKTASAERLLLARTGILRTAYLTNDHDEVTAAAGELLADSKTTPELANEARYYRSKAAAAKGEREQAGKDLEILAKDTRNIYGAEAKYRLAELHYTGKDYAAAEKVLLDYIEVSTPHAYWLARSFVLLADVYMQTGRQVEARQYLLSLKENYKGDATIDALIEDRLGKLSE